MYVHVPHTIKITQQVTLMCYATFSDLTARRTTTADSNSRKTNNYWRDTSGASFNGSWLLIINQTRNLRFSFWFHTPSHCFPHELSFRKYINPGRHSNLESFDLINVGTSSLPLLVVRHNSVPSLLPYQRLPSLIPAKFTCSFTTIINQLRLPINRRGCQENNSSLGKVLV